MRDIGDGDEGLFSQGIGDARGLKMSQEEFYGTSVSANIFKNPIGPHALLTGLAPRFLMFIPSS